MLNKSDLAARMLDRIKHSELWTDRSRETGTSISGLRCPECGHIEAWAYKDFPARIMCNRKNQCGARVSTLELFPELLGNIEKDFAPTRDDPHRPAREYLHARGLSSKSIGGLRFEYRRDIRKTKKGGVLFFVGVNAAGEEVWNGRIFSPPPGSGKTHNQGQTAGMFWKHPGMHYHAVKPTYVVEGIIDALSLIEIGFQAIAVLSSGQDPAKIDLGGLEGNLVIAFDPDSAGAGGLKKWKNCYPDARAILPLSGDWNDFLRNQAPGKAAESFDRQFAEMQCRADLALAERATDYADIWLEHYGYAPGLFEFGRCYWWASLKPRAKGGDDTLMDVWQVSDFTCETDHYQLDSSNPDNPVYRYHLKIFPAHGQPVCCSISGSELANPWSIKAALLSYARVHWRGQAKESNVLVSKIVDTRAPTVRQVHILGYDQDSRCCVFRDFLIDPDGQLHHPDAKGFFRASRKEFFRPPSVPCVFPKSGEKLKRIYDLITTAWPNNGALAIAWTVASWFVWAVKPELGFFPFLSLHGDTQTGKTHLVRKLNAMQCLDEEGLPMTKLNTGKGEIRKLAQRSGLFKALLEGNKEDKVRFDMESLLTLYNHGNSLQVRAVKSNGIETKETEFLSALTFVQNKEPFKSKAQMERVVSSAQFRKEDITDDTTDAFRELQKIPLRELGQVYVEVMKQRKRIEDEWYNAYLRARNEILEVVPDNRIAENHGLVLGFHRVAEKIFGANYDLRPFVLWAANRKHQQCNHRQATMADHFFEACGDMSEEAQMEFISEADGRVYIRLALALKRLDGVGYKFYAQPLYAELREHPAFIVSNWTQRGLWGIAATESKPAKVWVFDKAKMEMPEEVTK